MNQEVLKLIEDATLSTADSLDEKLELFATIIIKECCKMVNNHMQHNNPYDCLLVINIKERFGIISNDGLPMPICYKNEKV